MTTGSGQLLASQLITKDEYCINTIKSKLEIKKKSALKDTKFINFPSLPSAQVIQILARIFQPAWQYPNYISKKKN
jgi:hypothetical protein